MSTEKIFSQLGKYLEEHEDEIHNEEEYEKHVRMFMDAYNQSLGRSDFSPEPETADDYLELAEEAETPAEAIKYAKKALSLDKNNLDAECLIIMLKESDPEVSLEKLKKLIQKGERYLKKEKIFTEAIGNFWLAFETRPYMRVRNQYKDTLVHCGMFRKAAEECREMLRLCEGDNLGIRYDLMHIYAFLEEQKLADALYNEYSEVSTHLTLPYSILYYKLGDYGKAEELLRDLASINKDTKKFFRGINSMRSSAINKTMKNMSSFGERVNSIEEYITEIEQYQFLLTTTMGYLVWANKILNL